MKTSIASFFLLSMIACGGSSSDSVENADAPSAHSALNNSLSDARKQVLLAAFEALDLTVMTQTEAPAFESDATFAQVDVTSPIASSSFGHTTTLLVPAGSAGQPKDPNRVAQFYVAYGASTNKPAVTYGPFALVIQEGGTCGGFAPSLQCARGLSCVAASPDMLGTCQAQ